jgi:chemotaxis protein MotB
MSAGGKRRRGGAGGGGHDGPDERWLLTYADMITLLMALFMVLFSISAVNVSKFQTLQESLKAAFSGKVTAAGKVMPGGPGVMQPGAAQVQGIQTSSPSMPAPDVNIFPQPIKPPSPAAARAAQAEQQSLRRAQQAIDDYARRHGLSDNIRTSLDERGLVVRLLTDHMLFTSGSAALEPAALPLVRTVVAAVRSAGLDNPVRVEGNTDSVPISTARFHSNWELSTARATAVLEALLAAGVPAGRLSVAGYGSQNPVAPNTTADGRAANRRVDVVVLRKASSTQGGTPTS